ncbi:MAG: choice-of-anchor Q domain-containing protein [Dokdonella sp.]
MNAFGIATSRRASARFAIASEPATPGEKTTLSHLHTNQPPSPSATSRVKPLALALAVAVGASFAADHAAASDSASTRPDGSILWSVENCNDAGAGSLRATAAHAVDGDAIDLGGLACSTISLTTGSITLHDIDLLGPGANALAIDGAGNQNRRTFNHVGHGGSLNIHDVTLRNGKYLSNAGQGGGCLRSEGGSLRVYDSVFSGCFAFAATGSNVNVRGGAIAAYGGYVLQSGVTLANNQVRSANGDALGGAVYAAGTDLVIRNSTITNNSATAISAAAFPRGGGVFTHGWAAIEGSSLDGNLSEGGGGGAVVEAGGVLRRSTVSNNSAIGGASGIAFLGAPAASAGVYSSTISDNRTEASVQWGSGALYMNTAGAVIANSTIAGNTESNVDSIQWGAGILFGPAASGIVMISTIAYGNNFHNDEHTFIGLDINGPTGAVIGGNHDQVGSSTLILPAGTEASDPMLGPLQDNGGPTWTRMPAAHSIAINSGTDNGETTDQRGYPRVSGPVADVGAVETITDSIFANGFEDCHLRCL